MLKKVSSCTRKVERRFQEVSEYCVPTDGLIIQSGRNWQQYLFSSLKKHPHFFWDAVFLFLNVIMEYVVLFL